MEYSVITGIIRFVLGSLVGCTTVKSGFLWKYFPIYKTKRLTNGYIALITSILLATINYITAISTNSGYFYAEFFVLIIIKEIINLNYLHLSSKEKVVFHNSCCQWLIKKANYIDIGIFKKWAQYLAGRNKRK
jgi:hypothetical protein